MKTMAVAAFVVAALCAWTTCLAADPHGAHGAAAAPAPGTAAAADADHAAVVNRAVLPPAGIRWPAVMMIVVIGLFAAAAAVGLMASPHLPPEEIPVSTSHNESPGHGHDHVPKHGPGGHH